MGCFIVPATEAAVVTAVIKVAEWRQKRHGAAQELKKIEPVTDMQATSGSRDEEKQAITLIEKAKWLSNLLWGGSAMLAFEHLWHGELSLLFPFLTAIGDPADTAQLLHEMSTVGVGMAVIVTAAWGLMVLTTSRIVKRNEPKKAADK